MKAFRQFLNQLGKSSARFDRYYGGVIRDGSGYPTADEARKDMRRHDQMNANVMGWLR